MKNDHLECKTTANFLSLLYHNLITIYIFYHNKIFITTADLNGLTYAAYENEILHSKWKILAKSEVTLATRNWSGRLQFPIHSKKEMHKIIRIYTGVPPCTQNDG